MRPGGFHSEFTKVGGGLVVLRALKRSDLTQLLKFANSLVEERRTNPDLGIVSLDRRVSREDQRKFLNDVLTHLEKNEVASVAAFDGGRMVGNCDILRRKPHDVRHTGVLGIAILEGYRGMGLGEAMIGAALRQAQRVGIWLVELEVFSNNARARGLYRKIGFRKVGTVPNKILRRGRHIDEDRMYIDLRGTDKSTGRAHRQG